MEPTLGDCWSQEQRKSRKSGIPVGNIFNLLLSVNSSSLPFRRAVSQENGSSFPGRKAKSQKRPEHSASRDFATDDPVLTPGRRRLDLSSLPSPLTCSVDLPACGFWLLDRAVPKLGVSKGIMPTRPQATGFSKSQCSGRRNS